MNLCSRVQLSAARTIAAMRERTGRALHFHPRSLQVSQAMEIGKWLVKKAGRQKNAVYPSYRDLKSREMWPQVACDVARDVLGWTPVEDAEAFLDGAFPRDGDR